MSGLIISDNKLLMDRFKEIDHWGFHYACSPGRFIDVEAIDVKQSIKRLQHYKLIVSLCCKQIFPPELLKAVRCINIHPGYNPYNRGWFPHIFSIVNGLPAGVTIHEMDAEIDHGPVICQKQVEVFITDTSYRLYQRIIEAMFELIAERMDDIVKGNYLTYNVGEGNLNTKKDFEKLCMIDLNSKGTFQEYYNLLRALTHDGYMNAYFISEGEKVYVRIAAQ